MATGVIPLAKTVVATLLLASPLIQAGSALARYVSPTGEFCDKYMERVSEEMALDKQFKFAQKCLVRIRKETGRTHDAYLLMLSNIYEEQGMRDKAIEYAWLAVGAARENNKLDDRSVNDFLSISFLTFLLSMTGMTTSREDVPLLASRHNDKPELLYDVSLAVMKLSGCTGAVQKDFISAKRFEPHADIDFELVDTTLTAEDRDGHCGMSMAANLLTRIDMGHNLELVDVCSEARAVVKRLSPKRYETFRSVLGWIYLDIYEHVTRGKCHLS